MHTHSQSQIFTSSPSTPLLPLPLLLYFFCNIYHLWMCMHTCAPVYHSHFSVQSLLYFTHYSSTQNTSPAGINWNNILPSHKMLSSFSVSMKETVICCLCCLHSPHTFFSIVNMKKKVNVLPVSSVLFYLTTDDEIYSPNFLICQIWGTGHGNQLAKIYSLKLKCEAMFTELSISHHGISKDKSTLHE